MIRKLFALLVIAGVANAYPHESHDESTIVPTPDLVNPDKTLVDPERFPAFKPESDPFVVDKEPAHVDNKDPAQPEKAPIPEENSLAPTEIPEDVTGQADLNPDGDLKTDATFWPYYRTWYPRYRYRTYWHYPVYRTYYYHSPRYYWW